MVCTRMNRMRIGIEEGKEISPLFPRLHVKDAVKGGPKAPPRNKMALYEQFTIPSHNFASGSASLFPLPPRNYTGPTSSSHQDDFINSNNSLKALDGEDAFLTSTSTHGKNSSCTIIQNNKDEDKLARCNLSYSLESLNSFGKKVNSLGVVDLKSIQEHTEVSQIGQKPEERLLHSLDGFGDIQEHRSLKENIRNISVDSLKTLQSSSVHKHEENATFGSRGHHNENPAVSDIIKCPLELEIGRRCFLDTGDRIEDEETNRPYDTLNKANSECTLVMDISRDNLVGAIGEHEFWKARRTIINQQKIFVMQVFELHRLIEVQRLIASSPHILLEGNPLLNKPPPKTSTTKKFQSDFLGENPPSVVKLDNKSEKATTTELATNNAIGKIPIPCVNNITKGHANQISSYGHHLGNLAVVPDTNSKQSPNYVYPPPGNQWLVPVMSPSEGLVFKPITRPCPPNAGFGAPIYSTCGTMSFNPGSKDVSSDAALAPNSHQKFGILSSSSLPHFLPPPSFMHPSSISASVVEQMGQSNGPENHNSCGEVNSAILYQSSSNISSPTSQVMSRNISIHDHSLKDKELQISTASSASKRMRGEVLHLFPMAPTFSEERNKHIEVEKLPRVIKAMPHNPKSASESAARIFRSIQEERKHL